MQICVYVVLLERNKYYVGETQNLDLTIEQLKLNLEWTKLFKPVKIIEFYNNCDVFDLDKYTVITMAKYGIHNVRGGSFTEWKFTDNTIIHIAKMIQTALDLEQHITYAPHIVNTITKETKLANNNDISITDNVKYVSEPSKIDGHDKSKTNNIMKSPENSSYKSSNDKRYYYTKINEPNPLNQLFNGYNCNLEDMLQNKGGYHAVNIYIEKHSRLNLDNLYITKKDFISIYENIIEEPYIDEIDFLKKYRSYVMQKSQSVSIDIFNIIEAFLKNNFSDIFKIVSINSVFYKSKSMDTYKSYIPLVHTKIRNHNVMLIEFIFFQKSIISTIIYENQNN